MHDRMAPAAYLAGASRHHHVSSGRCRELREPAERPPDVTTTDEHDEWQEQQVPGNLWDGLVARGDGPVVLLGIIHDAPGITPPERCRFDAAIKIDEGSSRTVRDGIGVQTIAGGAFAITTHVGPYRTLGEAYRTTFDRIARMKRYAAAGLPCLELYSATTIDPAHELNQTDLCVRLQRTD